MFVLSAANLNPLLSAVVDCLPGPYTTKLPGDVLAEHSARKLLLKSFELIIHVKMYMCGNVHIKMILSSHPPYAMVSIPFTVHK